MATFGNCSLQLSGLSTSTAHATLMRGAKATLSELGNVSNVRARISVPQYPISPGDYPFKCVIYNDNAGYPDALQGTSEIVTLQDNTPEAWVQFNFSPVIELTAGDYWIGIIRGGGKGNYTDTSLTGGVQKNKTDLGGDFYNSPPATFPGGASEDSYTIWLCATYTAVTNPYPTNMLKKNLLSGLHCFISAYILAMLGGFDPLKLPDGTLF